MVAPIKKVDRSATICFNPAGNFLACGSVAGAIDLSFSTSSTLEIFDLDLSSPHVNFKPAGGAVQAPERFSRLAWGAGPDKYGHGLLAGGLADGSVCVWDPSRFIGRSPGPKESAPLARLQKHRGPVRGLEFNSFSPSLLASGAADGELCVWDLAKPATPSLYPAMRASGGAPGDTAPPGADITALAWNAKVQHIVATASSGGVVVWDLKKQRPVITLGGAGRRAAAVRWNPEVATQLVVASDDDASPALQLWDLRNAVTPLREFVGHSRGVLGLSWCTSDPALILSSGKDNRTLVWDVSSASTNSPLLELPPGPNWSFEVRWAPGDRSAGLFAGATFEGSVSLHSLGQCVPVVDPATGLELARSRPVPWLKRPASARFGFGGRLARCGVDPAETGGSTTVVRVDQVRPGDGAANNTLDASVDALSELEQTVVAGDREALRALCERRERELSGQPDAEIWAFLGTHFADDATRYLLSRLGFAEDVTRADEAQREAETKAAEAAAEQLAGLGLASVKPRVDVDTGLVNDTSIASINSSSAQGVLPQTTAASTAHDELYGVEGADAFFDNLSSPVVGNGQVGSPARAGNGSLRAPDGPSQSTSSVNKNVALLGATAGDGPSKLGGQTTDETSDSSTTTTALSHALDVSKPGKGEEAIQRALTVGDVAGAVEAALRAGREADAVLLASLIGGEKFIAARLAYMAAAPRPFMSAVAARLKADESGWDEYIRNRAPKHWKETLALLLSSAPAGEFTILVGSLASKLASAGDAHAASLCVVCAGDVDAAVARWAVELPRAAGARELAGLVEKALVLAAGSGVNGTTSSSSHALTSLLARYADALVSDGRLAAASAFLELVPAETAPGIADLKDRIAHSMVGGTGVAYPTMAGGVDSAAAAYAPTTTTAGSYGVPAAYTPAISPSNYLAANANYGVGSGATGGSAMTAPYSIGGGGAQAAMYGVPAAAALYTQPEPSVAHQPPVQQAPTYEPYASAPPPAAVAPPTLFQPATPTYGSASGPIPPPPVVAPPPSVVFAPQSPTNSTSGFLAPPAAVYTAPAETSSWQPTPAVFAAPPPPQQPPPAVYGAPPATAVYAPPVPTTFGAPPPTTAAVAPASLQQAPPSVQSSTPASPASSVTNAPSRPGGPPPGTTLLTVDPSSAPAALQPIIRSLVSLYSTCEAAFAAQPGRARELEDAARRLGTLAWRLSHGGVSDSVASKLHALCGALDAGGVGGAARVQAALTRDDWDESSGWLSALKRLIKLRQMLS